MRLYDGSYLEINHPEVSRGRAKVDFGQGFYLTSIQSQAEKWAKVIAFRIKSFKQYDVEWLRYVVDCRRGGTMQQSFDVVEGGVANDNVIDTVEDFENGRITAEQALGQLVFKKVNHQLCIRKQEIIDQYLSFVSSYEL